MTHTETPHHALTSARRAAAAPWWWTPSGVTQDRINLAYLYDAFRERINSDRRLRPCVKFAHGNERHAARQLNDRIPGAGFVFRSERAFLDRAATYLAAEQDVTSIVIAGAGLPHIAGDDDIHSLIRRSEANSRNRRPRAVPANMIYVERDPLVLAHLRTLSDPANGVHVVDADPWDPAAMWEALYTTAGDNPGLIRPEHDRVALLLGGAVLSFHGGTRAEVAHLVQGHLARLPVGTFLALTHLHQPAHPVLAVEALDFEAALQEYGPGTGSLATTPEIAAMIHGTSPLPPGIVPAFDWYPAGPPPSTPACGHFTAAVLTQKPGPDHELPEPPWGQET